MELYVIRHADAVLLGEGGITEDEERPLTDQGRAQARALGAALQQRVPSLGLVLSSPLLRARQTAEAMLEGWPAPAPTLEVCDRVAPAFKPRKLARYLREAGGDKVAVVGHEPDLSMFVAWLIGSRKAQVEMAKGGMALVQVEEPRRGGGTLQWLVPPEWLA